MDNYIDGVDVEVISHKKKVYGNNLPNIKEKWSNYLQGQSNISESDVSYMMYLMKVSREEHIKNLICLGLGDVEKLTSSLNDTIQDKNNYLWISYNYDEYVNL